MRNSVVRRLLVLTLVVVLSLSFFAFNYTGLPEGKKKSSALLKSSMIDYDTWIDVNNVRMVTTNRGSIAWDNVTGNAGLEYPRGTGKLAIFAAGIWMGGMVSGELRYIMCDYGFEWFPGAILSAPGESPVQWADGTDPKWQVWKLSKEDGPENPDYAGWISNAEYGAPMNPDGTPLVTGDQTLWTIFNDADPSKHTDSSGSTRPMNIETKETIFAFDKSGPLGNTVFVKLDFINKGPDIIEDYYCSFWSDPDLGDAFNDLVGCDPELGLGYCFNADNADGVYVGEGACVGYDFFQGVRDDAGNILGMTSFNKYINGTDPRTAREAYNYQQGLTAAGTDLIDPTTGNVTKYYCSGDPVTNSGWVDSAPADRRLMLSTGPTTLYPGDENTVVVGLVLGSGRERLGAISAVRYNDIFAQGAFDTNFEIPPDPPAPNVTIVTLPDEFFISWGDNAEDYTAAGYSFEGYNVYVTNKPAATQKTDWKRVDTFDLENGVQKIFGLTFDETTGLLLESPIQFGGDTGIKRFIRIDSDLWVGGGYPLVAQKEYYYAVTSYAYNPIGAPLALESVFNELTIIPKGALPGTDYSVAATGTDVKATHSAGSARCEVDITVVNPQLVTGQSYKVDFGTADGSIVWNLWRGGTKLLADQTNFSGDWDYPFVDGLLVKIEGLTSAPTDGAIESTPASGDELAWTPKITTYAWDYAGGGGDLSDAMKGHDIEIRFTSSGSKASMIEGWGHWGGSQLVDVPFELWDIQEDPPVQVNGSFYDRNGSGDFTLHRNYLAVIMTPYSATTLYGWDDPMAGWTLRLDDGADYDPTGDVVKFVFDDPIIPGVDEFTFNTQAPIVGDETIAEESFKKDILIVPNPYYGFSMFERTRFQRIMLFTNLPEQCTIRSRRYADSYH